MCSSDLLVPPPHTPSTCPHAPPSPPLFTCPHAPPLPVTDPVSLPLPPPPVPPPYLWVRVLVWLWPSWLQMGSSSTAPGYKHCLRPSGSILQNTGCSSGVCICVCGSGGCSSGVCICRGGCSSGVFICVGGGCSSGVGGGAAHLVCAYGCVGICLPPPLYSPLPHPMPPPPFPLPWPAGISYCSFPTTAWRSSASSTRAVTPPLRTWRSSCPYRTRPWRPAWRTRSHSSPTGALCLVSSKQRGMRASPWLRRAHAHDDDDEALRSSSLD